MTRHPLPGRSGRTGGLALALACLAALATLFAPPAPAAGPQVELNGWKLLQMAQAMKAVYGAPHKVVEEDGLVSHVYFIDRQAYMVAATTQAFPHQIASLQLTGTTDKALPFLGLRLGDPASKVLAVLGEPSGRVRVEDWKVTRHDYTGRNYSIEIDDDDKLYSIRIHADATVASEIDDEASEPWRAFADALASGDTARILDQLRPDIGIYRHGRTLGIGRRFHDFSQAPDQAFIDALVGEGGVLAAVAAREPEERVLLSETMGTGLVFAFPEDSGLVEVVFFPYAGRFRVYEIAFRAPAIRHGKRTPGDRTRDGTPLARLTVQVPDAIPVMGLR